MFPGAPPNPSVIRVLLVDDHAVVRAGYRRLLELEPDMAVVKECADADSAYEWLQQQSTLGQLPAEVMVLDLSMPGRSGLDLLRRVGLRWPLLRVLVFSMHDSLAMVTHSLCAGATGFVTKNSAPEELVAAVRSVSQGKSVLSADVAHHGSPPELVAGAAAHEQLSRREFDVLRYLVAGLSVDDIAQRLSLSPKTVANHQSLIRQKLGVNSAVELLRYAREHRLDGV
jgi:DNA-binding NarL/FixJ family response regulator